MKRIHTDLNPKDYRFPRSLKESGYRWQGEHESWKPPRKVRDYLWLALLAVVAIYFAAR